MGLNILLTKIGKIKANTSSYTFFNSSLSELQIQSDLREALFSSFIFHTGVQILSLAALIWFTFPFT
jgi:hypothetical protein